MKNSFLKKINSLNVNLNVSVHGHGHGISPMPWVGTKKWAGKPRPFKFTFRALLFVGFLLGPHFMYLTTEVPIGICIRASPAVNGEVQKSRSPLNTGSRVLLLALNPTHHNFAAATFLTTLLGQLFKTSFLGQLF